MRQENNITPPMCYFFIVFIFTGIALLIFSLFNIKNSHLFLFLLFSALGILLVGIGEWINHPLQESITFDNPEHSSFKKVSHRKRNPIALGNILEIIGLILIFTGMAYIFR